MYRIDREKTPMTLARENPTHLNILAAVPVLFLSAVVMAAAVYATVFGPAAQAAADRAEAQEIDAENREFCALFGVRAGESNYANCASGLAEIRRRQSERISLRSTGIL
jgi:hypothetical protein